MKTNKNISNLLRAFVVLVMFTAASCTPQDELVKPEAAPALTEDQLTAAADAGTVSSLTVTGAFTEFRDQNECSTCTYVVPEDATVVDGKKLGIKPGDVICLSKAFKYKAVEIINADGTGDSPVIIAECGE